MQPDNWMVFPFQTHPFQTMWLVLNYSSLLPGKLIDLSYLKRSSKISSNITYPSFQYFISPHSDFHRKKSLLKLHTWEPCNNSYPQQKMTEAEGHQKNPYFFQLLCHYLKSLATREHNSTWKSFFRCLCLLRLSEISSPCLIRKLYFASWSSIFWFILLSILHGHRIPSYFSQTYLPSLLYNSFPSFTKLCSLSSPMKPLWFSLHFLCAKTMSCTEKQDVGWNYRIITWDFHKHL